MLSLQTDQRQANQFQQQLLQHHNRESSFVLSTEIDGSSSSKLSQGVVEGCLIRVFYCAIRVLSCESLNL